MKGQRRTKSETLRRVVNTFLELAGQKIVALNQSWDPAAGAPVFTREGVYGARGWTEWTQGFQYGCQVLAYDGLGDDCFLDMGRRNVIAHMAPRVSHAGVHDHGFNCISTYGNLRRLAREGRSSDSEAMRWFYEMALKVSGAVQASRWTNLPGHGGYIYSFNGPHSLFIDAIRSCRSLMLAHQLGQVLMAESDHKVSLQRRAIEHMMSTASFNVYYGEGRDAYDVRGRVAHESIFNVKDGSYRCPSTQQGYSPFSTWTRGLAWSILGFAEELEYLATVPEADLDACCGLDVVRAMMLRAARASSDFYLANSPADGIPYWDTGAPGLAHMGDYLDRPAEPDNSYEPVDSSAAAIAAQGLVRLGRYLGAEGKTYWRAGLAIANTLFQPPYLSENPKHQGLILHSVYHRPRGWDYIPPGKKVPSGESSMWGDYHAIELAVYLKRDMDGEPYMTFFDQPEQPAETADGEED